MSTPAQQCAQLIKEAEQIAVLTGAGISTNAGIPDFRGPKGLYVTKSFGFAQDGELVEPQYDADKVFDIGHFYRDPKPFYDFARDFLGLEERIAPTFTHKFLTDLEHAGKLIGVITQNIDYLHQRAGSKNVLEMHGSFWTSFCLDCNRTFSIEEMREKILLEDVPKCVCSGVIKPDIVFFGENVKFFEEAAALAGQADLFFVIGTSCVVYPAASVPSYTNGKIVLVNKGEVSFENERVTLIVDQDTDEFFQEVRDRSTEFL